MSPKPKYQCSKRRQKPYIAKRPTIEQVTLIKYLGPNINSQVNLKKEILPRIEQVRRTLMMLKIFFKRSDLRLMLRTRMVICFLCLTLRRRMLDNGLTNIKKNRVLRNDDEVLQRMSK